MQVLLRRVIQRHVRRRDVVVQKERLAVAGDALEIVAHSLRLVVNAESFYQLPGAGIFDKRLP